MFKYHIPTCKYGHGVTYTWWCNSPLLQSRHTYRRVWRPHKSPAVDGLSAYEYHQDQGQCTVRVEHNDNMTLSIQPTKFVLMYGVQTKCWIHSLPFIPYQQLFFATFQLAPTVIIIITKLHYTFLNTLTMSSFKRCAIASWSKSASSVLALSVGQIHQHSNVINYRI